ncbi:MAG: M67 family metallopeptidase [Chloroflexi bacterium]|nr:M67 family metallopeptidase [Chloroflexota bacterium]MCY4247784.1 M67 family metallopeptidase [Chloroflexota bacterium]
MSRIYLSEFQKQRIFHQLEQAYPEEAAGFLLGHMVAGYIAAVDVVIDEIVPVDNVSDAGEKRRRFVVKPQDWMRLEDQADASGLQLIGCYHSHPDAAAIPSAFDLEHSYPNFLYIIVAVNEGRATDMRSYELSRKGSHEHITAVVSAESWQEIMSWPHTK